MEEVLSVKGTPLQPNPGQSDSRIKTRMEPGLSVPVVMGDPVTTQDVARAVGEQRPFYMLRANAGRWQIGLVLLRAALDAKQSG